MPAIPSPAQAEASRLNGARSAGPLSAEGKARSALNGVRHGLCGRVFFLLPDEDPAEFREHAALWLAVWTPRDLHEHEVAEAAIRAMWRERRADRLEAIVLDDLFAAGELADAEEARAAKAAATKALGTLLRYRNRIERERTLAMQALDTLGRRPLAHVPTPRPSEPEPAPPAFAPTRPNAVATPVANPPAGTAASPQLPAPALRSEPEPNDGTFNRHQRRALAAMTRRAA